MVLLEATTHLHSVWGNVFFYLFIGIFVVFTTLFFVAIKALKKKASDQKLLQQQHVARVDVIRKENSDKLESLRVEMLKREQERSRQWMESEKETLHVLNGVSKLLELSDKVDKVEFKKINKILSTIEVAVNKLIQNKNNGKT